MSRLDRQLSKRISENRKALIPFVTAGDPSLEITVPLMHAMVRAGADVIELGVPFSDPMADGPVIQQSSERAIVRGAGLRFTLEAVRGFRLQDALTPVVLMGYLNPIDIRGADKFAEEAVAAGVDGVLLVDLPPEESAPFQESFSARGLSLISLVAPTTTDERLALIVERAEGYIYYVSYAGVTGSALGAAAQSPVLEKLRILSGVPIVAGFGIRDAQTAVRMAEGTDGVVIGSALVERLNSAASDSVLAEAESFLRPIREALDCMR